MNHQYFIGVDVGTGSARAGVFDSSGNRLASASREIQIYRPAKDFVEQSSRDIWEAVCHCVRTAVDQSGIEPQRVAGIGFDATCSLVVLGDSQQPVTVSPDGDDDQNVIVWMDHRAVDQAARINRGQYEVLKYVGDTISPEMQTPKLLWLKEHMPQSWKRAKQFFDLPDFLTFMATGDETRSLCSTVCKWTYLGHASLPADGEGEQLCDVAGGKSEGVGGGWDGDYLRQIGLGDLVDEQFRRIGNRVRPMGEAVGRGVTAKAAAELGVAPGTAVGVSIIDAHAGGIGMIGAALEGQEPGPAALDQRLALIGGTSSCHMAVSASPRFIRGIWGPYYSAMVPGMWLTEGGQSATGALIDFVVQTHGASPELEELARVRQQSVYEILNDRLDDLAAGRSFPASLTSGLHICPYFHGNRSPWADPSLRGMISGLSLSASLDDLAILYLAVVQAIAYGTRHIIEEMNAKGYCIDTVFACGGGIKNRIFIREHADITGCRVVLPREPESVLLGSAMLGAVAAGRYPDLVAAMAGMSGVAKVIEPAQGATADFHQAKYTVFRRMHDDQLAYRELMAAATS
ncbi:FGGY-family carbohydrate kinase [Candidatus Laterigemmans baculatus]|uniref:FGGY-family carbohydrate kinase n=1 Tax=Candidatus Laterigemmans baculatus TaxID=2770505 RepID=UPI0013DC1A75|nr:FGGY-family carbohydrate kinase [Candidatus Laterigemmans baculatus]